jgi:hypothetical protein
MTVQIDFHLRKCTGLVQCDVKNWFIDIFEEHEDRYMFCGKIHVHMNMGKHVMRYLKGTIDYKPRYISKCEIRLQIHIGPGSVTDQKITSRYCFSMRSVVIS